MRKSCLNCARKHLALAYVLSIEKYLEYFSPKVHIGQAEVLFDEYLTGDYDIHFWLSIGHLSRVESFFYSELKIELADFVRRERIRAIDDFSYRPNFHRIIDKISKIFHKPYLFFPKKYYDYLIKGNTVESIEETILLFPEISRNIKKAHINKTINFIKLIEFINKFEEEQEKNYDN